jgi:hypothetical protein
MDDFLDDVREAQQILSEAVGQARVVVDRLARAARQLEAVRAEVAEERRRARNVLEMATCDAEMILQQAKTSANEITARARNVEANDANRGD